MQDYDDTLFLQDKSLKLRTIYNPGFQDNRDHTTRVYQPDQNHKQVFRCYTVYQTESHLLSLANKARCETVLFYKSPQEI